MIVLRAKDVNFEVTYIDLSDKPGWFLEISPHGKVPVLVVDDQTLFESNAIAEYLEETVSPSLHPDDPVKRARNRAWTDYISDFSDDLGSVYYSDDEAALTENLKGVRSTLEKLESAIAEERGNDGPFFNGAQLSLVDAAYAPFLQRFAIVEEKVETGLLDDYPLVKAWSKALLSNHSVVGSVAPSFQDEFVGNLKKREKYAGTMF